MIFQDVVRCAKGVLRETGSHSPQLIVPNLTSVTKSLDMLCIPNLPSNKGAKEVALKVLRKFVESRNTDYYFTVFEAWMKSVDAKKDLVVTHSPSKYKDRESILVVSEYRKDRKNKMMILKFDTDENGKAIFREEKYFDWRDNHMESYSKWDFFLEDSKEAREERFLKERENMRDVFFKSMAKEFSKKYFDEFNEAGSEQERMAVLDKLIDDAREFIDNKVNAERSKLFDKDEDGDGDDYDDGR